MNYIITNELLTATFSSNGGELKSLVYKDKEYMLNDKKYWNYTSPLLFPIIGKLKENYTVINGKRYDIPKHGIIRTSTFELLNKTNDEISFIFKSNDETIKLYPYHFNLILSYKLEGKKLLSKIEVLNTDSKSIYFNIGLHPAFILADPFDSYKIEFEKPENSIIPYVESDGTINFEKTLKTLVVDKYMPLKYEDYSNDAVIIRNCNSKVVKLLDKNNKGIKFDFHDFSTVAFWTPGNLTSPFICIEPWIGHASKPQDSLEFLEKDFLIELKETSKLNLKYYFEVID